MSRGDARFLVLALDEQPIVVTVPVAGTHSHQMPAAVQLLAVEIENEVALGVALVRIAFRDPTPAIPDHDGAAAILALRDRAFECVVFDRMVLDVDGKSLFVGIEARAAGHGPTLHHAVELEPQIIMQPPRGMLLNHIAVTAGRRLSPSRLRGHVELSLFAVGFESHEALIHAFAAFFAATAACVQP